MPALLEFVDRLVQQYWRKLLRYGGVSVFNVLFGQSLLFFFHTVIDWPGWIANVTAVMISAVPAYLLSRHWVWGQRGPHSFKAEVLPFWSMALLGLTLSTVAVAIVDNHYDGAWPVQLASLAAFFLVWILKFFVLDRLMWRESQHAPIETAAESV